MKNKYIVVRKNSTSGAFVVELNEWAPIQSQWTRADVGGYADTEREAERIAAELNACDIDKELEHERYD